MKKKDNISVTKEELGDVWSYAENALSELKELHNRIYKYSNWLTNLGILLLGFFLAILFQLKSQGIIPSKFLAASVLFFLCCSIGIGFYFKIRYEVADWYSKIKSNWKILTNFFKQAQSQLEKKGAKFDEVPNMEIKLKSLEKIQYDYPFNLLYYQFAALVISLISLTIYLVRYIFID